MNFTATLDYMFLENTIRVWLMFLAATACGFAVLRLIKKTLLKKLKQLADTTETDWDDLLLAVLDKNVYPYFYYLLFLAATKSLTLKATITNGVNIAGKALLAWCIVSAVSHILRHMFETRLAKTEEGKRHVKELSGLFNVLNFVLWALGLLLLMDNLGFKVSTLLAGMGIGGVAVALAAQAVLGDLFAYFAILFDKPFEIGDFIVTGDFSGTIEHIGIKTTRIRSISGEQIIFSNSDLLGSRPRNYKRMSRRRVVFKLGVTYDTPKEKLEMLPGLIAGIIKPMQDVTFDRSHFSEFGASSMNVESVYFVENADYTKYMDIQQQINLAIMSEFKKLGVEMAFPTQTLYIKK